jgi:hypothetical protein
MPEPADGPPLPESLRCEVFAALVTEQDRGLPVPLSRAAVERRFGLSAEQLKAIEREGLDNGRPPL